MVLSWAFRWIDMKRAMSFVKGLETLLNQAQNLIDTSEGEFDAQMIKSLKAEHAELVVTIRSDVDKRGKRFIFFVDEFDKKEFYGNLKKLRAQCEVYRDDMLTVSEMAARNASGKVLSSDSTSSVNLPKPESNGSVFPVATPSVSSSAREVPLSITAPLSAVARLPREVLPSLAGLPSGATFLVAGTLDEHALSIAYDIRTHSADGTDTAESEISRLSREGIDENVESSSSQILTDNPLAFELAESFVSALSSSSPRNI